ncbi:hypothetical protein [Dawidia soli]|uniref:Uncharacterized protein n=1 Tax=Dawidia soli TaxID=2782352 RepID=A0AAP2DA34_9BACT|nr:hypothetical protein [Dawidia soli]MBT1687160.1 hypothetical protein [Dawidia soli]
MELTQRAYKDEIEKFSTAQVIDMIRQLRDGLIAEFLQEEKLRTFFVEHYDVKSLSQVRIEFLKRDLKEIQKSPLDLAHYAGLIKLIKETNSAALSGGNDALFFNELETVFKKYTY